MSPNTNNSMLIMGTGAMACLFAARLSAASYRVTMLGTWREGLQALRKNGVVLVDNDGSERSFPVQVTNSPQDCNGVRFALVLVKSWQTQRAAQQLAECLSTQGLALTLQNGLGNLELLAQFLGAQCVALGVTTTGATLLGPGRVRPGGEGVISLNGHPRMAPIARMLSKAGFTIETTPDATALLWGKLVINAAINPITALLGIPNGELLARETTRSLLRASARETAAVASAQGIQLPYPDPVAAVESIASRTAKNRSSMLQDVQRGAPTEIDAICGAIVQAGERTGIQTPINSILLQLVKAMHPTEKDKSTKTSREIIRGHKMEKVTSLADLRDARARLPAPVGFVPTMGYLHEGHLSLVRAARAECASVVVSIFVNPTQFSPNEDLSNYPRDVQRDLNLLKEEGVDLVWTPTPEIMYPPGYQTWITVEEAASVLEGSMRPGHFRGVATVVAKLFNAIIPDKAYFGQKDAQQAVVIRRMTHDLNFNLDVVVCPTIREPDGLALSSRNVYLNPNERQAATVLCRALVKAQVAFSKGDHDAKRLLQITIEVIESEPLARLQYVSCAHPDTLHELEGEIHTQALLSMAVYIGKTRLIDNVMIGDQ